MSGKRYRREGEDRREEMDGGVAFSECVYVSIDAPLRACLNAAWCLIYCKNGN